MSVGRLLELLFVDLHRPHNRPPIPNVPLDGPARCTMQYTEDSNKTGGWVVPELHAELCLHIGGSPGGAVLMALCTSVVLDTVAH